MFTIPALGPVRLFTPYKRKRRTLQDIEDKKPKLNHDGSIEESDIDNLHQNSNHSHSKEAWQSLAEGLDSNADYSILENTDGSADVSSG